MMNPRVIPLAIWVLGIILAASPAFLGGNPIIPTQVERMSRLDENPLRTLLISVSVGVLLFVFALFVLLTVMDFYGGVRLDPSVLNFYPLMAGAGVLFGFERWWAYEQGGVNPFHEREVFTE